MKTLILVLSFLAACTFAQPTAPTWLNQIRLSGISGLPDHPLAAINNKTLSPGEECDLKLKGRTIHLSCLEIHEHSVLIQFQNFPGRYELNFSSTAQLVDSPVVSPPPQPVVNNEPPAIIAAPQPSVVVLPSPPSPAIPSSENDTQPLFGVKSACFAIIAALLLGITMGSSVSQWQHRKNIGEALLADTIGRHFRCPHLLLNNITLRTSAGTTQIDHVLVADTGIFVIETKHYAGWIFGNPSESQWTQVIYHRKSRFQNPLRQNYAHIKALKSLFNLPEEHFQSIVVFTGEAVFKSDLGGNVLRLASLIPFLSAPRPTIYDEDEIASIVGRIEMKRERRSLETDEYHLNHLRRRFSVNP